MEIDNVNPVPKRVSENATKSRNELQPVIRGGQVVPRLILPLSVSYDHRVIDGADAARFTRRITEMLENPLQMLL